MKLTQDQVLALGRAVISAGGGFLVGRGTITAEQSAALIGYWPDLVLAVGALLPVLAGIWGAFKASPQQQINSVAANDAIKIISASNEVAASSPSAKVVPEADVKIKVVK